MAMQYRSFDCHNRQIPRGSATKRDEHFLRHTCRKLERPDGMLVPLALAELNDGAGRVELPRMFVPLPQVDLESRQLASLSEQAYGHGSFDPRFDGMHLC